MDSSNEEYKIEEIQNNIAYTNILKVSYLLKVYYLVTEKINFKQIYI